MAKTARTAATGRGRGRRSGGRGRRSGDRAAATASKS